MPENSSSEPEQIKKLLFWRVWLIVFSGGALPLILYFFIAPFTFQGILRCPDSGIRLIVESFLSIIIAFPLGIIGNIVMIWKIQSKFFLKISWLQMFYLFPVMLGGGLLGSIGSVGILLCLIELHMATGLIFGPVFMVVHFLMILFAVFFAARWTGIGLALYIVKVARKTKIEITPKTISLIGWRAGVGVLLLGLLIRAILWKIHPETGLPSWIIHELMAISIVFGISYASVSLFMHLSEEEKLLLQKKLVG